MTARAFTDLRDPLSLQLASVLNGGRPTEPDKEAAGRLLPRYGDPPELASQKMQLIYLALLDADIDEIEDPVTGEIFSIRSGARGIGR